MPPKRQNPGRSNYFQRRAKRAKTCIDEFVQKSHKRRQSTPALRHSFSSHVWESLRRRIQTMPLQMELTSSNWNWKEDSTVKLEKYIDKSKHHLYKHDFFDDWKPNTRSSTDPDLSTRLRGEQRLAYDLAVNKRTNVFITGGAGVGKSITLQAIVQALRRRGYRVVKLAPTGIAADNIQGTTIDSFIGVPIHLYKTNKNAKQLAQEQFGNLASVLPLELCDVIVMDEISMCGRLKFDVLHYRLCLANQTPQPFGGKQVIVCGDFFQLPPIEDKPGSYVSLAFESEHWSRTFERAHCVELITSFRQQDPTFVDFLNRFRVGQVNPEELVALAEDGIRRLEQKEGRRIPFLTHLYGTRAKVKEHNTKQFERLLENGSKRYDFDMTTNFEAWNVKDHEKHEKSKAMIKFNKENMTPHDFQRWYQRMIVPFQRTREQADEWIRHHAVADTTVSLAVGSRVMLTHNVDVANRLVKSRQGWITHFDEYDRCPFVLFDYSADSTKIEPFEWSCECQEGKCMGRQIPLELAWAMTIHKSQSLSLSTAAIDLSDIFAEGQAYVALSRLRSWAGLFVLGYDPEGRISPDERVLEFYRNVFPETWSRQPEPPPPDVSFETSPSTEITEITSKVITPKVITEPIMDTTTGTEVITDTTTITTAAPTEVIANVIIEETPKVTTPSDEDPLDVAFQMYLATIRG